MVWWMKENCADRCGRIDGNVAMKAHGLVDELMIKGVQSGVDSTAQGKKGY